MIRSGSRALAVLALAGCLPAFAQDDALARAMRDEMARSMEELRLGDMEKPYFVSYTVRESKEARVTAALGGVISRSERGGRMLLVEVRAGSPSLDNTNFLTRPQFGSALGMAGLPTPLPLEDDYGELRRKIWLATDIAYKQALDYLAKKRAALENETRVEEVPDFSEAEPYRHRDDRPTVEPDAAGIEALARDLSAVFQGMPHIFVSEASAMMEGGRISYLNSEGTEFVRLDGRLSVRVSAGTQAEDGTPLEDAFVIYGKTLSELPSKETLIERARGLAERLRELREAPLLDRYTGPVLFEGQAAAELVRRVLVPRLLAVKEPVVGDARFSRTARQQANPFLDKLGSRVLPRFLNVANDPTADWHGETPLLGGYGVDDEGVPGRRTAVVQRGILKTLLATRNPAPGVAASTGSRRGGGPAPSNLFVEAQGGLEPGELREELLALAEERELEYAIRIRRIGGSSGRIARSRRGGGGAPGSGQGSQIGAVVAYKVFPDGREELIRHAALMGITEGNFRDIVAASKGASVHTATFRAQGGSPFVFGNFGPGSLVSLVVPDLLFEDVTVRRPPGNIPRPPVVAHPLAAR